MSGAKHKNDKSWKPGQSPNPGGRSKRVGPDGRTLAQLARDWGPEALDVVREIYLDKMTDPKDRIRAAEIVMDRGWGKPKPAEDGEDGEKGKTLVEEMFSLLAKKLPD